MTVITYQNYHFEFTLYSDYASLTEPECVLPRPTRHFLEPWEIKRTYPFVFSNLGDLYPPVHRLRGLTIVE